MKLLLPAPVFKASTSKTAPRPVQGKPLKVGLLYNGKPNGDVIVRSVFDAMAAKGLAAEAVVKVKHSAGFPVSPEALAELTKCDLVLNALAN